MDMAWAALTAAAGTILGLKCIKPIALRLGLVDKPCARKQHDGHIPLVGGISVFVGVLFTSMLWLPESRQFNLYLIASAIMVFIGALDDRHNLSVRVRLVGQVLVASIMIFGAGIYIKDLGNLFGFGSVNLGWFGIPFTYLAVLGAINAYNMIDGIDGLVGTLSVITLSFLATLFLLADGNSHAGYLSFIVVIAILPFLFFNLFGKPNDGRLRKIFMGDAGSMFIGFTVVWLLAEGCQGANPVFQPVLALWIIAVPLMDMASVMIRRWRKGQSPFIADRDHLHHIFMRAGFSASEALIFISCIAAVLAIVGTWLNFVNVPSWMSLFIFMGVFSVYSATLQRAWTFSKWLRMRRKLEE
ncbi:MAG: UDP-N-acetylglucosamine--undecaprenyl-phosphate N-acetylglucosaminephosphotransferase [Gammaproteobacteria bacterium]|nr:UDP-N-acetylglucosamine--undecaprenyl-phosphate N-acetylglucosaminephosphotransferase [Gammaproteobacteria bacterium]